MKSNIACLIAGQLLQESGCEVISFRNNDILDRLVRIGVSKNKVAKTLLNMPSLIVVDRKKEPRFVTVRYLGNGKSGRNIDWGFGQLDQYWPGSLLLIVTDQEPFFLLKEKDDRIPLTRSVFKVNKKASDKYACLVRKFLS